MRSVDQQARHPLAQLVAYLYGSRRDQRLSRLNMDYTKLTPDEQGLLERVGKRAGYQTGRDFLQHLQATKARQQ
jgi:hypothetical protein